MAVFCESRCPDASPGADDPARVAVAALSTPRECVMLSAMNARAPRVRLLDLDAVIHDTHTRMPFRYGIACLTSAPSLHVRLTIENDRGQVAQGIAADGLPPRWFDKDPEKSFRQNVEDQILAMQTARSIYLDQGRESRLAAEHWEDALPRVHEACAAKGLNGLTASFGSSFAASFATAATMSSTTWPHVC